MTGGIRGYSWLAKLERLAFNRMLQLLIALAMAAILVMVGYNLHHCASWPVN